METNLVLQVRLNSAVSQLMKDVIFIKFSIQVELSQYLNAIKKALNCLQNYNALRLGAHRKVVNLSALSIFILTKQCTNFMSCMGYKSIIFLHNEYKNFVCNSLMKLTEKKNL